MSLKYLHISRVIVDTYLHKLAQRNFSRQYYFRILNLLKHMVRKTSVDVSTLYLNTTYKLIRKHFFFILKLHVFNSVA